MNITDWKESSDLINAILYSAAELGNSGRVKQKQNFPVNPLTPDSAKWHL